MKVPVTRAFALGEFTPWGRQFLGILHAEEMLDITFEPSTSRVCKSVTTTQEPLVAFVENTPESRSSINLLRESDKKIFIIWFGRSFTKEDLAYAIQQRVYCVFENLPPSDKRVVQSLYQLEARRANAVHVQQLLTSLRSILLQAEDDEVTKPLVSELKAAVAKLAQESLVNEFHQRAPVANNEGQPLPMLKNQDLGDAITTISDLERTGVLWIRGTRPEQECKIYFLTGKLVSAKTSAITGLKAVYRSFLWDSPRFLFSRLDPKDCVVDQTLDLDMKYLCEEGRALKNRYQEIRKEVPPEQVRLAIDPASLHPENSLGPDEFATLASVVEYSRVGDILDYNPLPDVRLFDALIKLRKNHLIRVSPAQT